MAIEQDTKKRCRRCRETVRHAVLNELDRFCCRGCFRIYYAKRCIICEQAKTSSGLCCTRPVCKAAWAEKRRFGTRGRWAGDANIPDVIEARSETPIFTGVSVGIRHIAGPDLSPLELRALQTYGPDSGGYTPEQRRAAREMRLAEYAHHQRRHVATHFAD